MKIKKNVICENIFGVAGCEAKEYMFYDILLFKWENSNIRWVGDSYER